MSENLHPRIPAATYRLQFHAGFTFRDACAILDYLRELGISDVYASPYFQASPTSTHGYDVANHNRISSSVGGEEDFRFYTAELRRHGLGQVLDFVPNHMGIGQSLNQWWMEVLEDGTASPFARYFDIDWHPGKEALAERVLLPVLGDRYGKVLENGELKLGFARGAFSLGYFETRLPINPRTYAAILREALIHLAGDAAGRLRDVMADFGALDSSVERAERKSRAKERLGELARDEEVQSAIESALGTFNGTPGDPSSFDRLHDLLESQPYRLAYWRVAAEEINYRRFFDINTLAAIRIEIPEVFEAAHHLVFEMLARGDVTGLRIDHIDGLWNPREYLARLQKRYAQLCGLPEDRKSLYLLVEKIIDLAHEQIPADWACHGTTGYEFANQMTQVLVESGAEKKFTRLYQKFTGLTESFADLIYEKKKLTMQIALSSEVAALGRMLDQISEMHRHYRDLTRNTLTAAVEEVIACFPVYRTYATEDGLLSAQDEKIVLRSILAARRRNPSIEKPVFDFLRNLLLLRLPDNLDAEQRDLHIRFVMKFQQCSGPVMAKGLEDTSFYIFNRLAALNEVGGNPGLFGLSVEDFHRLNSERLVRQPHMLLATSTHDTKRSEDVRARLAALSELPDFWHNLLKRWSRLNHRAHTKVGDESAPSPNEEYLLYQTLLGSWPLEPLETPEQREAYAVRIRQYTLKTLKEAKINSSWTEPNEEWEKAVEQFIETLLDPARSAQFLAELAAAAERLAALGALNSLTQTIAKCTLPGVPDFYQGTEIWDFSLVDPDNRRPVDYAHRRALLAEIRLADPVQLLRDWRTGGIKLFTIARLLAFRRDHAAFFREAGYRALEVTGSLARHAIAFAREHAGASLVVILPRFPASLPAPGTGLVWKDTALPAVASARPWRDLLTGREFAPAADSWLLADLLSELPFAVLHSA